MKGTKIGRTKVRQHINYTIFLQVFLEDLSGFPPQRQVGFRIDLVPRATPVTKISVSTSTIENARVVKTTLVVARQGIYSAKSLSVGSTCVVREEGRFILYVHRLLRCTKQIFQRLHLGRGMTTLSYGYAFWVNQCTSGFMNLIDWVCKSYLDEFVIVIVDDILIYSNSKEEHEVHLKLVLELLKKEKLVAKFSKCEFWIQEVYFLGHVVKSDGIHVDPSKIEAMKNWKVPKTPSEIRSFLGLTCAEQEEAFKTLKDNLCNAPILSLPDGLEDFIVYCDASNQGLGCVLMQRGKVIAYTSRQLKIPKKNFTTHDLELGAVLRVKDKILVAQGEASKNLGSIGRMCKDINNGQGSCIKVYGTSGSRYKVKAETSKTFRLTKSSHFLAIREDYKMEKLERLYIDEIVSRHGVPVSIISDRVGRFTSRFWQMLQKALGTQLDMSTTYHPQMNAQIDFSYNISYHSSIRCAPFEALYGRKCRSPVLWAEIGESQLIRPELVQETTDKVIQIKEMHKAYRRPSVVKSVTFEGGSAIRKKGKLAPRYVGPFENLERIGPVAYQLRFPQELSGVHDTFHVLNLKKCLADASLHVPLGEVKIDKTLCFVEEHVEIMDREVKKLKCSRIPIVKVL
ncbi:putative reverse transcriptase domain-containing protein [Tanacetum coccineum]